MKKVLSVLLVLLALMSVSAFAETQTYTAADDETYSIKYTAISEEEVSGTYYALLVVEGIYAEDETPIISEDTVLYVDQATSATDDNGDISVTFDGWIPKNDEPATVYLGSNADGFDSPTLLGYLGESTFVVAGTVTTDSGTTYEATVTLTNADGEAFTTTSVSGAYTIEVPEDTYTFKVNVKNHLSYTQSSFAVAEDVSGKDVTVKGGDVNNDGTIQLKDLSALLAEFGVSDAESDINADGSVTIKDLSVLLSNYNFSSVSE